MQSMVLFKTFLQWMKGSAFGSQAFDGSDRLAIGLYCKDSTAFDAFAVQEDGTCTATTGVAADMSTG
jgi:hypothetical protein